MKAENKKYLIYGGLAFLIGSLAYFIYTTAKKKTSDTQSVVSSEEESTPTTEPTKTNPFTDLLNNVDKLPSSIEYKPTNLSKYF
jgi:hypothetical protein